MQGNVEKSKSLANSAMAIKEQINSKNSVFNQTQAYYISVNEVDEQLDKDPGLGTFTESGADKITNQAIFKESHPAVYMPKHQYCKYKMAPYQDKSGLKVLGDKPISNKNFAIFKLL